MNRIVPVAMLVSRYDGSRHDTMATQAWTMPPNTVKVCPNEFASATEDGHTHRPSDRAIFVVAWLPARYNTQASRRVRERPA